MTAPAYGGFCAHTSGNGPKPSPNPAGDCTRPDPGPAGTSLSHRDLRILGKGRVVAGECGFGSRSFHHRFLDKAGGLVTDASGPRSRSRMGQSPDGGAGRRRLSGYLANAWSLPPLYGSLEGEGSIACVLAARHVRMYPPQYIDVDARKQITALGVLVPCFARLPFPGFLAWLRPYCGYAADIGGRGCRKTCIRCRTILASTTRQPG